MTVVFFHGGHHYKVSRHASDFSLFVLQRAGVPLPQATRSGSRGTDKTRTRWLCTLSIIVKEPSDFPDGKVSVFDFDIVVVIVLFFLFLVVVTKIYCGSWAIPICLMSNPFSFNIYKTSFKSAPCFLLSVNHLLPSLPSTALIKRTSASCALIFKLLACSTCVVRSSSCVVVSVMSGVGFVCSLSSSILSCCCWCWCLSRMF